MIWVFVGFGLLFLGVALLVARRSSSTDIDDFIVAGRRLPFGVISASILVSWLWTTSLLGAAEAGYLFGIGGGFAFALGSAVPFFVFIPLALRLRRLMPEGTTFLEFIEQRFGRLTHHLLIGMMLLLALYICVEQMIGIAYAISGAYGTSFKLVALCATAVVVAYITISGLRGAVINDVIQFVVISLVSLVVLPLALARIGLRPLYDGLARAAADAASPVHTPGALNFFAAASVRYFVVALVVSFGFVLLNQGYFSKARAAANSKSLLWSYIVGTLIAWLPIPILFGTILGGIGIAEGMTVGEELTVSTDVGTYVIVENFGAIGGLLFSLTIFMAGLTTAGNTLVGFQANFAVDVQDGMLRQQVTPAQRKRRTQIATIIFGVLVAVFALLLEGVSLLQIDILSGIIFATPMAGLVAGLCSRRPSGTVVVTSIVMGLVAGIATYLAIDDPDVDYFYGNVVSLLVPAVVVVIGGLVKPAQFDFAPLRAYRSRYQEVEQTAAGKGD